MANDNQDIIDKYHIKPTKIPFHHTDRFGFVSDTEETYTPDNKLYDEWLIILEDPSNIRENYKTCKLIFKGIPLKLKQKVWMKLLNPKDYIQSDIYNLLRTNISTYEHQIHVDVQRTFRKHGLFFDEYGVGQNRLFGLLVAYANFNKKVGYCQGMSSFAGLLLMYFPERSAFDILRHLIDINKLDNLFDNKLSMLNTFVDVQNVVCKNLVPSIYEHIIEVCELKVFVTKWYMTLFSRFDIELVLRIWDLFMYYDVSVLFLVVTALLKTCKKSIMKKKDEYLLHYLTVIENEKLNVEQVIGYVKQYIKKGNLKVYCEALNIM